MTLLKGVDSFTAPTATQLALAKADGVRVWAGYLPGPGIDSTWTAGDFARIKAAGLFTLAYASQRADPKAQKALAAAWGVKGALDCEGGIQPFNLQTQGWLDASGFGFYHEEWAFPTVTAAFHIIAAYQGGDPMKSWPGKVPRPNTPTGWQWSANKIAYGAHIDRAWYDSEIFVVDPPVPPPAPVPVEEDDVTYLASAGVRPKGETADPNGQGAVYLCSGLFKRHLVGAEAGAIPELEAQYGPLQDFSSKPFDLDHLIELAPLDASYPTLGWTRPADWQPPGPVE